MTLPGSGEALGPGDEDKSSPEGVAVTTVAALGAESYPECICTSGCDKHPPLDGVAGIDQESASVSLALGMEALALGGEEQTSPEGVAETTVAHLGTESPPE